MFKQVGTSTSSRHGFHPLLVRGGFRGHNNQHHKCHHDVGFSFIGDSVCPYSQYNYSCFFQRRHIPSHTKILEKEGSKICLNPTITSKPSTWNIIRNNINITNVEGFNNTFVRTLTSTTSSSSSSSSLSTTNNMLSSFSSGLFGVLGFVITWYSRNLDRNPIITKSITSGIISGTGDIICQLLQRQQQNAKEVDVKKETFECSTLSKETTETTLIQSLPTTATTATTTQPLLLDVQRTSRFVILGTCLVGPLCHFWYSALAKIIIPGLSTSYWIVSKRVFVDQIIFAPVFLLVWSKSFQIVQKLQQQQEIKQQDDVTKMINRNDDGNDNNLPVQVVLNSRALRFVECNILIPCGVSCNQFVQMMTVNWLLWIPTQTLNFRFVPLQYQVLFSNLVAVTWNVYLSFVTSTTIASVRTKT